jgi:hypothetical protein
VHATYIGTPDVADPRRATHKRLVPTAYGLLVHEAGHAAHSRWLPVPPGTPPVVADPALLLEESRTEGRHRTRRRGDRRWLCHTVTSLLTGDEAPVDDARHAGQVAGQVAGLLLARSTPASSPSKTSAPPGHHGRIDVDGRGMAAMAALGATQPGHDGERFIKGRRLRPGLPTRPVAGHDQPTTATSMQPCQPMKSRSAARREEYAHRTLSFAGPERSHGPQGTAAL